MRLSFFSRYSVDVLFNENVGKKSVRGDVMLHGTERARDLPVLARTLKAGEAERVRTREKTWITQLMMTKEAADPCAHSLGGKKNPKQFIQIWTYSLYHRSPSDSRDIFIYT